MNAKPYHPIFSPEPRHHTEAEFSREEVMLAHHNNAFPLEALAHDVTPAGLHYVLTHFDIPYVPDAAAWRLAVLGAVPNAGSFSVADIRAMPQRTLRVTLECAGNGRIHIKPRWRSMPWSHEAVSTAEWTGTPLKNLLAAVGVKDKFASGVVEVSFLGVDRGFDKGVEHNFGRSLKPAMALSDDVLVVHAMNGQPLLPQHGFPLRLIVPGWYGMASVKWLDRIEVLTRPFDGFQQVGTYHFRDRSGGAPVPVTTMRVKSLIKPPGIPDWYSRARLLDRGRVVLEGRAWAGGGRAIKSVLVAIDGVLRAAFVHPKPGPFAWQKWTCEWDATPGEHILACRAIDDAGAEQPLDAPYDAGGFGNNGAHMMTVTVR
ncbi:MAG TPA: sulfite oxidase [Hyphomicrobiaceae bacterium]|nr:sulfite oxidase [Hyphomicrobiaceae bacterium]